MDEARKAVLELFYSQITSDRYSHRSPSGVTMEQVQEAVGGNQDRAFYTVRYLQDLGYIEPARSSDTQGYALTGKGILYYEDAVAGEQREKDHHERED